MQEIIAELARFDTPTVFNALVERMGLPNEEYTDHHIRALLPESGCVVGYAATLKVTTNDGDAPGLDWLDYYAYLEAQPGPLVAVLKDVDSRPGRGASFGDGMARVHQRLGVVGVLVEGTVRDLAGIRQVGLPVWAWGTVPGHGVFRASQPLRHPGDGGPIAHPAWGPVDRRRRWLCAHPGGPCRGCTAIGQEDTCPRARHLRLLRSARFLGGPDAGAPGRIGHPLTRCTLANLLLFWQTDGKAEGSGHA
jgi:regulator of RNase E activity RraA